MSINDLVVEKPMCGDNKLELVLIPSCLQGLGPLTGQQHN